jgi:gas vesicle protein
MGKPSKHLGIGMILGTAIGVTTGLFLQSKKGKVILKDNEKRARKLQSKLMSEFKNVHEMSKEKYEGLVDRLTDYYVSAKEISKSEIPVVKNALMKRWADINKQLKNLNEDDEE